MPRGPIVVRGKVEVKRKGEEEGGWPGEPPCSRNARAQKPLVGRAQLEAPPGHPPVMNMSGR